MLVHLHYQNLLWHLEPSANIYGGKSNSVWEHEENAALSLSTSNWKKHGKVHLITSMVSNPAPETNQFYGRPTESVPGVLKGIFFPHLCSISAVIGCSTTTAFRVISIELHHVFITCVLQTHFSLLLWGCERFSLL